jgi:hypothetical protein
VCLACAAAIMKMKKGPLKGKVYTDKDWNDENTVSDGPYQYSKVRRDADHTADSFAMACGHV